jgi:hypothetical protein
MRISKPSGLTVFSISMGTVNGLLISQLIFDFQWVIALTIVGLATLYTALIWTIVEVTSLTRRDRAAFNRLMNAIHNLDEAKDRIGLDTEELT